MDAALAYCHREMRVHIIWSIHMVAYVCRTLAIAKRRGWHRLEACADCNF